MRAASHAGAPEADGLLLVPSASASDSRQPMPSALTWTKTTAQSNHTRAAAAFPVRLTERIRKNESFSSVK